MLEGLYGPVPFWLKVNLYFVIHLAQNISFSPGTRLVLQSSISSGVRLFRVPVFWITAAAVPEQAFTWHKLPFPALRIHMSEPGALCLNLRPQHWHPFPLGPSGESLQYKSGLWTYVFLASILAYIRVPCLHFGVHTCV